MIWESDIGKDFPGKAWDVFLLVLAEGRTSPSHRPLHLSPGLKLPLPERMQTGALVLEAAFVLGVVTGIDHPNPRFQKLLYGNSHGWVQTAVPGDPIRF